MDIGFMIRSLEDIRATLLEIAGSMGQPATGNPWEPERIELVRAAARLGAHLIYLKHKAKKSGIDWEKPIWPEEDIPF